MFDSSVTDDNAITTANVPSAALVRIALDTASMILSNGGWDTHSFMIQAWPKCCHLVETYVRVRDLAQEGGLSSHDRHEPTAATH